MIYKVITFKLSYRSIVRLLFVFMASNKDMKAKKARTLLYFLFLIFYLRYILVGIQPTNVEGLVSAQLRNCQQRTFVILNRFFPLSKNHPPSSYVLNRQYYNGQNTNQNQMKNKLTIYTVYTSSFEGNSCIKICKMSHQIFYFLLLYTSLYIIQQTSFFTNFQNFSSLNIICKKHLEFSFFNGSTETLAPTPLTAKAH